MRNYSYEEVRETIQFWQLICSLLLLGLLLGVIALFVWKKSTYLKVPDEDNLVYDDETKVVYKLVPYEEDGYTYKYLDEELVLTKIS